MVFSLYIGLPFSLFRSIDSTASFSSLLLSTVARCKWCCDQSITNQDTEWYTIQNTLPNVLSKDRLSAHIFSPSRNTNARTKPPNSFMYIENIDRRLHDETEIETEE